MKRYRASEETPIGNLRDGYGSSLAEAMRRKGYPTDSGRLTKSLDRFHRDTGVSVAKLHAILRGEEVPDVRSAKSIAYTLRASVEEIFLDRSPEISGDSSKSPVVVLVPQNDWCNRFESVGTDPDNVIDDIEHPDRTAVESANRSDTIKRLFKLAGLSYTEKEILKLRYTGEVPLEDIGDLFLLDTEVIKSIGRAALKKIREAYKTMLEIQELKNLIPSEFASTAV